MRWEAKHFAPNRKENQRLFCMSKQTTIERLEITTVNKTGWMVGYGKIFRQQRKEIWRLLRHIGCVCECIYMACNIQCCDYYCCWCGSPSAIRVQGFISPSFRLLFFSFSVIRFVVTFVANTTTNTQTNRKHTVSAMSRLSLPSNWLRQSTFFEPRD